MLMVDNEIFIIIGGKLIPRLPEGTRVGKLVMGKYGLYNSVAREIAVF